MTKAESHAADAEHIQVADVRSQHVCGRSCDVLHEADRRLCSFCHKDHHCHSRILLCVRLLFTGSISLSSVDHNRYHALRVVLSVMTR
jgi:hypothetical protein